MQVNTREALRALAHPLRMKILFQLETDGHGRAADLAQTLGEPANSVSFHLRTLAKAGLVVEAPELARDKRDRVWRAAAETYNVAPGTPGMDVLVRGYVEWFRSALNQRAREPDQARTKIRFAQVALTTNEARELFAELDAVVERFSERAAAAARTTPREAREIHNVVTGVGPSALPQDDKPAAS
ncbi:ArsR family transcriptional regulator [Xylanimonas protaetiae]|uniref:ArsR family transcriptional regulator n=2 Tax=Xylanimonas protaetiae TaxID=2509457 RepID=A0A4P6FMG3_9MICO|nr:ArsR family transcriptional regulator [Xylanimonas protaetiae]